MGLLDSIAGAVLGGGQGGVAQIAMEMFNQHGGIGGVLEKLQAGGLGDAAASWVSKGENIPVTADQITSALGSGAIADMAAKFGLNPADLSAQIAQHLPNVIDKMTPNGAVEANSGNMLSAVLGMFK
jgi:uncharacterized protein YidB (DUF937 family)